MEVPNLDFGQKNDSNDRPTVRFPPSPKSDRVFRIPRMKTVKSNLSEFVNTRRYSFSHIYIKPYKPPTKRRGSYARFSQGFEYLPNPSNITLPAVTKSAETLLYESLHRLMSQYLPLVRNISDFVFMELIGQGGFGQVWLANDLKTGKLVAIKELFAEKLVGKNLVNFVREIVTMAKTYNRFVLPFVGFTVDKPYCIITEYMPNSSLNVYLHKEITSKIPVFSGTHLTMIAIGIIHALRHLHSIKIVHRDIKSANILLDHHYLPKLCDFGVARIIKHSKFMSDHVGTPAYMAPETLKSNNYDFKVDIFSFGMLLYNMIEKKLPYAKLDRAVIFNYRKEGHRPQFTRKNTQCMFDLVNMCWAENPKDRPTASQIYSMFLHGKVYFEGTDQAAIKKFMDMLESESEARKKNPKLRIVYKVSKAEAQMISNMENKVKQSQKKDQIKLSLGIPLDETHFEEEKILTAREASKHNLPVNIENKFEEINSEIPTISPNVRLLEVIQNPSDPRFKSTVTEIFNSISPQKFEPVYIELAKIITETTNQDIVIFILEGFTKMIERSPQFIKVFNTYHFYSIIPVISNELMKSALLFIGTIFKVDPNSVSNFMFRSLGALLRSIPQPTLYLFASFINNYSKVKNPDPVLDFFLNYAREFINSQHGALYLRIVFRITKIEAFYKFHHESIINIFSAYTRSEIAEVSRQALKAFTLIMKPEDAIPFDAIILRLKNDECIDECISLLTRTPKFPESPPLLRSLSEKCANEKFAQILLKFVSQSQELAALASRHTRWMTFVNMSTLKLFLYEFTYPDFRYNLLHSRLFPIFMTKCLNTMPDEAAYCLGPVLRRSQLDQTYITHFSDFAFFDALFNCAKKSFKEKNVRTLKGILIILDTCAAAGYHSSYKLFLEMLASLLKTSSELTKHAALIFVTFSSHQSLARLFKNNQALIKYFQLLQRNESMQKPASIFLSNLMKV